MSQDRGQVEAENFARQAELTVWEVFDRLRAVLSTQGLTAPSRADLGQASVETSRDPFDGIENRTFSFRRAGEPTLSVQVRADERLSAELFVSQVHPKRSGYFVEAIDAWGRRGDIHSDLRMSPLSNELKALLELGDQP